MNIWSNIIKIKYYQYLISKYCENQILLIFDFFYSSRFMKIFMRVPFYFLRAWFYISPWIFPLIDFNMDIGCWRATSWSNPFWLFLKYILIFFLTYSYVCSKSISGRDGMGLGFHAHFTLFKSFLLLFL